MQPRGPNAPPQFLGIVFERYDQHSGSLKNVLAGEPTTPGGLAGRAGTWQP
jgi:hypothetical protein